MSKVTFRVGISLSLLLFCYVPARSQTFSVPCPQGYQPVPFHTTADGNGNLMVFACVDPFGKVTLQPFGISTLNILNTVLYVGTGTSWAGIDVCAQINTAAAAAITTGQTISIIPQLNGYTCTTPVVLTTASKPISIICGGPGGSKTGPVGGSCLINWTPTTGTAFTLDYLVPSGSGGTSYTTMRDIAISNNGCTTTAGCGGSAIGVLCGNTNSGCGHGEFSNFHVSGFLEGVRLTSNNGWGVSFKNFEFLNNATGLRQTVGAENTVLQAGRFLQNATGLQLDATSELNIDSVSWDGNTTTAINCGGAAGLGVLNIKANHFENPALGTSHYITGNSCIPVISDGTIFSEDNTTGTTDWMIQTAGFALSFDHAQFTSAGRTFTSAPIQANNPVRVSGTVVNDSPAIISSTAMVAGTSTAISLDVIPINNANNKPIAIFEKGVQVNQIRGALGSTTIGTCTFATGGGTSPSCALTGGSTDSMGVIIATTGTGAPGATGTITITFASAIGPTGSSCVLTLNSTLGAWNPRATIFPNVLNNTASETFQWDNNAVNLTASTVYEINYFCPGR